MAEHGRSVRLQGPGRQKVRPSMAEMAAMNDTLMDDYINEVATADGQSSGNGDPYLHAAMRRATLDGAGVEGGEDEIPWRIAATAHHAPPPQVVKGEAKAGSASALPPRRSVRFAEESDDAQEEPRDEQPQRSAAPAMLMGAIKERPAASHAPPIARASAYPTGPASAAAAGPGPASRAAAPAGQDVWLDENGKPMSAFRKKRLMQQGHTHSPFAPSPSPSSQSPAQRQPSAGTAPSGSGMRIVPRDLTRDPGGGAGPEAMLAALEDSTASNHASASASVPARASPAHAAPSSVGGGAGADAAAGEGEEELMRSISDENSAKVAAMSADDVRAELASLEKTFGADLLQRLRDRKAAAPPQDPPATVDERAPTGRSSEASPGADDDEQADPQADAALLQQVSRENDAKIAAMDQAQVQDELQSLQERFGSDMLERLRQRKAPHTARPSSHAHASVSAHQASSSAPPVGQHASADADAHTHHAHAHSDERPDEPRFGLQGELLASGSPELADAEASGEAFTIESVLQLCRSASPAQRRSSLALLLKILASHPPPGAGEQPGDPPADSARRTLVRREIHARTALLSAWMLSDPARNIRDAALDCLVIALQSVPEALAAQATGTEKAKSKARFSHASELVDELLQLGVLRHVDAMIAAARRAAAAAQDWTEAQSYAVVQWLCSYSGKAAEAVVAERALFAHAVSALSRPPADPRAASCQLSAIRALDSAVRASRKAATAAAATEQLLSAVLRVIHSSSDGIDDSIVAAVDLLTSFACYGLATTLAATMWETLTQFVTADAGKSIRLRASVLRLFGLWTICATDPHVSTPGGHDIVWDTVKDWPRYSLAVLSEPLGPATGAAAAHLDSALRGAQRHPEASVTFTISDGEKARIAELAHSAGQAAKDAFSEAGTDSAERIETYTALLRLARRLDVTVKIEDELASACSRFLEQPQARPSFTTRERHASLQLAHFTASSVALLSCLQPGEEAVARRIIEETLAPSAYKDVLAPFFTESIRDPGELEAALVLGIRLPSDVAAVQRFNAECDRISEVDPASDVDPATGSPFWRNRASKLPLAKSWPLLPLDELLHSGNSAVFNRPGALPQQWDHNETAIVFATLSLTLDTFASAPPPSGEIWLGLAKVYLLEGSHAAGDTATGAATGRDIFRESGVAAQLKKLAAMARAQENGDTLEQAHARLSDGEVPFFQIYSDLLGVYDAVSFGDAIFAQTIVQPLKMAYAVDYRRLFWNDFAQVLPTVRLSATDVGGLDAFCLPAEPDVTMLELYAASLLSGSVQEERSPLLFAIAIRHLAAALFGSGQPPASIKRLARMIFEREQHRALATEILKASGSPEKNASVIARILEA